MKKTTLFCLVIAVLLTGCGSANGTSQKNNVQATKTVQQSNYNEYLMGGKIAADVQADITTKISAKVAQINVDLGSQVNQGDVIITLDTQDLQAQVDQAQAAVNTAKANLVNAQNSVRPEQVASAEATLESAIQSYEVTKKNYDRTKALVDSGAAALQQLDTAQQQLAAAEAQKKSAQENLNMLKNGPTDTSIGVYEAQVSQAEAALKTAQTALNNATITSPISGVVNAKNINVGELATPGAKLISVVNASGLYVNAYAPLDIINELKVGQDVIIKVSEIADKQFNGKIAVINTNVNSQSRDVLVKVTIKDPDSLLKPGMFAEVRLKK